MANTFAPKILGHLGPTLLTPPLFLAWRSLRHLGCLTLGITCGAKRRQVDPVVRRRPQL